MADLNIVFGHKHKELAMNRKGFTILDLLLIIIILACIGIIVGQRLAKNTSSDPLSTNQFADYGWCTIVAGPEYSDKTGLWEVKVERDGGLPFPAYYSPTITPMREGNKVFIMGTTYEGYRNFFVKSAIPPTTVPVSQTAIR
jgi:hypothetical protein